MAGIAQEDTASPRDAPIYRHEPLPDPSTHIRLLELVDPETWEQGDMRCRLTIWPVKQAPSYHAISYTWGDPAPSHRVRIDGSGLAVPKNTADVLDQLAYFRTSRYYWIDAICIAQGDIAEKNGQVGIMGDVYKRAKDVLVCLGNLRDGAENAMLMIAETENGRPFQANLPEIGPWGSSWPYQHSSDLESIHEALSANVEDLVTRLGNSFTAVLIGLADLSWRPYFARVWVVQELILASTATLCCGRVRLPAGIAEPYLRIASWIADAICSNDDGVRRASPQLMATLKRLAPDLLHQPSWYVSHEATNLLGYHARSRSDAAMKIESPHDAIMMGHARLCTDKRDTVYGLLALIDWPGSDLLRPDYNKSLLQLALEFLQCGVSSLTTIDANILTMNLGLGADNSDLPTVIRARQAQRRACDAQGLHASTDPPSVPSRLRLSTRLLCRGLQLTKQSCRKISANRHMVRHGNANLGTEFLTLGFDWGDWMVFEEGDANPYGFIVRSCGSGIFEFVGYACCPWVHPSRSGCERFDMFFDPEDCLLSALIGNRLSELISRGGLSALDLDAGDGWTRILLETPIFKSPLSSFARLATEVKHGVRSDSEVVGGHLMSSGSGEDGEEVPAAP